MGETDMVCVWHQLPPERGVTFPGPTLGLRGGKCWEVGQETKAR